MTPALDAELLLRESAWLLDRALSLAADAADDLVQDTWLAALEHPPRGAAGQPGLRAWLATVARNLARSHRRSAARRATHDTAFGSIGADGSFDLRVSRPGSHWFNCSGHAGPARARFQQQIELAPGENYWARDLPTGTVVLANVPAFERADELMQEAPAYCLEWRDDAQLVWRGSLHAREAKTLTIPLVPAGRVRLLRKPEGMRQGFPDESWPLVLEFDLLAGETKRVELP